MKQHSTTRKRKADATKRAENLSASLEDYLEAIFNLADESDSVRSTDIAKALGVAKPSVTGALRVLNEKELVDYKPYDSVKLTEMGREVAKRVARRHSIIESFFTDVLGVEEATAQQAACRAEHVLGAEVMGKLLKFIEFVNRGSRKGQDIAKEFRSFCRRKSRQSKHNTDVSRKDSDG